MNPEKTAPKSSAFVVCWNVLEAFPTNSVDLDQTVPRSSLIWVHTVCLYT